MKRKTLIPLATSAIAAMLAGINTVDAKTLSPSDILRDYGVDGSYYNDVYVIGNCIFQDTINLREIMIASRGTTGEPIIYHLNSDGKTWSDAVANQDIADLPEGFDVDSARLSDGTIVDLTDEEKIAELRSLEEAIKSLKQSEYTGDSWKALEDAMKVEENGTTAQVKNKIEVLTTAKEALVYANKASLDALKAKKGTLKVSDYTIESYNEFLKVYESIDKKPESTYAEIQNKVDLLATAYDTLVLKDTTDAMGALTTAIDAEYTDDTRTTLIKEASSGSYTQETWLAYTTAIKNARDIEAKGAEASNSELVSAKEAIINTRNALKFTNKDALDTLKAEAAALVEDETYTAKSRENLNKVATTGDEDTVANIDTKMAAIKAAQKLLITVETENALSDTLKNVFAFEDQEGYEAEYSKATRDALKAVYDVALDKVKVTEAGNYIVDVTDLKDEDVQKLTSDIEEAFGKLEFTDLAGLKAALEAANKLVDTDYDATAWGIFQTTKGGIKTEGFANNAEVKANKDALDKAMIALKESTNKVDKTELLETLEAEHTDNTLNTLKITNASGEYTAETYQVYTDAVAAAKTENASTSSTMSSVEKALNNLKEAKAGLRADKTSLQSAIDTVKAIIEKDSYTSVYTKSSRDDLATAYDAANLVLGQENPTVKSVQDTKTELLAKKDALTLDKSKLTAELDEAYGLDEDGNRNTELVFKTEDHATNSYTAYTTAITSAKSVEGDNDATAEDIADAIAAVITAKGNLITKEVETALSDAIKTAKTMSETDSDKYTQDTLDALAEVLAKTTNVAQLSGADYIIKSDANIGTTEEPVTPKKADIADLTKEINDVIAAKVFSNAQELKDAKDAANSKIASGHYTEASVKALQSALTTGDESTYDGIKAKITAIESVSLVFINQAELDQTKEDAKLDATKYDTTAIVEANKLPETTYEEINVKIDALKEAIETAYANPLNKAELEEYKTLNEDGTYTDASYALFVQKCEEIIASGDDSTYTTIELMLSKIEDAKTVLVTVKSALVDLVAEQYKDGSLIITNEDGTYTAESYNAYKAAAENAKTVSEKSDATNEEVREAMTTLEEAIKALA